MLLPLARAAVQLPEHKTPPTWCRMPPSLPEVLLGGSRSGEGIAALDDLAPPKGDHRPVRVREERQDTSY